MPTLVKQLGKLFSSDFVKYHNEALQEEQVGETGPDPYFWTRPEFYKDVAVMPYRKRSSYGRYSRRRRSGRSGRRSFGRGRASKKAKFSTRNIGEPVGTATTKTAVTTNQVIGVDVDTNSIYTDVLDNLAKGIEIDERLRGIVNCRGFKLEFEWRNKLQTPLLMNIAVLAPKDGVDTGIAIPNEDFFRSYEAIRAVNFDPFMSSLELHMNAINTDKYTVLRHKRFTLAADRQEVDPEAAVNTWQGSGKSYRLQRWYIKLNRQLRFDDSSPVPRSGRVYLVFWCSVLGAPFGSGVVQDAVALKSRAVMYFREPKN